MTAVGLCLCKRTVVDYCISCTSRRYKSIVPVPSDGSSSLAVFFSCLVFRLYYLPKKTAAAQDPCSAKFSCPSRVVVFCFIQQSSKSSVMVF